MVQGRTEGPTVPTIHGVYVSGGALDRGHLFEVLRISWSHLIGNGNGPIYNLTISQDTQLNDSQEHAHGAHRQITSGLYEVGIK